MNLKIIAICTPRITSTYIHTLRYMAKNLSLSRWPTDVIKISSARKVSYRQKLNLKYRRFKNALSNTRVLQCFYCGTKLKSFVIKILRSRKFNGYVGSWNGGFIYVSLDPDRYEQFCFFNNIQESSKGCSGVALVFSKVNILNYKDISYRIIWYFSKLTVVSLIISKP